MTMLPPGGDTNQDPMDALRDFVEGAAKQYPGFGNMSDQDKLGVMQRMVQAVMEDSANHYRQTLRTAGYADQKQSRLAAGAINEALRVGASISPYINITEAQNGERGPFGVRGQLLTALTHTSISTNYHPDKGSGGKNDNRQNPLK